MKTLIILLFVGVSLNLSAKLCDTDGECKDWEYCNVSCRVDTYNNRCEGNDNCKDTEKCNDEHYCEKITECEGKDCDGIGYCVVGYHKAYCECDGGAVQGEPFHCHEVDEGCTGSLGKTTNNFNFFYLSFFTFFFFTYRKRKSSK